MFKSFADAGHALVGNSPQQVPRARRYVRVRTRKKSDYGFDLCRRAHGLAFALPLQHQPIAGWATAVFRRSRAPAAEANRGIVAVISLLTVEHPDFPLPQVNGSAGVQEFLLRAQLEIPQRFGARSPAETVVLLPVNTEDETQ